ncbi:hypothetical protein [Streptomyces sp. NPDC018693]|uniref:hypothetical protein n=1 Tax=unclassified Streptomyces TaxID=2593676 RepID=UPI003789FF84
MRGGLTEAGPTPARGSFPAVITAAAVLTALALFVSACATGGTGARDEGPAHAEPVAGTTPSAPSAYSENSVGDQVDAVRLVQDDPAVSAEVKRGLKPCVADKYPVDVQYGDLTGGPVSDIVVNVLTCSDAVGVGVYVYRQHNGRYENVFKAEEPPVYAEMERGYLVVSKQLYDRDDPVSDPSGENVLTYRWTDDRFVEKFKEHTDYGSVTGEEPTPVPEGG